MERVDTKVDQAAEGKEGIIRRIVLGDSPPHIADLRWYKVLPPPGHYQKNQNPWTYLAIAAVHRPAVPGHVLLITEAVALVDHPKDIRIAGMNAAGARAAGMEIAIPEQRPPTNTEDAVQPADTTEAYLRFYVDHRGHLTDTEPDPTTYADIPQSSAAVVSLRALAIWHRSLTELSIPDQDRNRLIPPIADIRPFLPY